MTAAMEFTEADRIDALRTALTRAQFFVLNPPTDLDELAEFHTQMRELYRQAECDPVLKLRAQTLLRRAERLLGLALIPPLERGEITGRKGKPQDGKRVLAEFISPTLWQSGKIRNLAALFTDDEFEQAISICRANGMVSQMRLLALVPATPKAQRVDPRTEAIQKMADRGNTADTIAKTLGINVQRLREIARRDGITIRADRLLKKQRSMTLDAERVIDTTISSLQDLASGLAIIEGMEINPGLAKALAEELGKALRPFSRLQRKLMEEN